VKVEEKIAGESRRKNSWQKEIAKRRHQNGR
jgi:hypothetical protein